MKLLDRILAAKDSVGDAWRDRDRIREDLAEIGREAPDRWRSSDRAGRMTLAVLVAMVAAILLLTLL